MLGSVFNTLIVSPLESSLLFIYQLSRDFGIAVIILTILIRILLFPLEFKRLKSQEAMAKLQPKIKALQEKHRGDQAKLAEATMGLYREHQINPLTGMLSLLVQFPILIGLYQIFINLSRQANINPFFLGIINLGTANYFLAFLSALVQYWQIKISAPQNQNSKMGIINYIFPGVTFLIGLNLPAALPLYWMASTLFMILEQKILKKFHEKNPKSDSRNSKKNRIFPQYNPARRGS